MTGSKSNPPIEAEHRLTQRLPAKLLLAGLHLQSVHIVVVGRRRLNTRRDSESRGELYPRRTQQNLGSGHFLGTRIV